MEEVHSTTYIVYSIYILYSMVWSLILYLEALKEQIQKLLHRKRFQALQGGLFLQCFTEK